MRKIVCYGVKGKMWHVQVIISDSNKTLQKLIDVVHSCCDRWRLIANVSKSTSSDGFC